MLTRHDRGKKLVFISEQNGENAPPGWKNAKRTTSATMPRTDIRLSQPPNRDVSLKKRASRVKTLRFNVLRWRMVARNLRSWEAFALTPLVRTYSHSTAGILFQFPLHIPNGLEVECGFHRIPPSAIDEHFTLGMLIPRSRPKVEWNWNPINFIGMSGIAWNEWNTMEPVESW
jgi:hypothetical protein